MSEVQIKSVSFFSVMHYELNNALYCYTYIALAKYCAFTQVLVAAFATDHAKYNACEQSFMKTATC